MILDTSILIEILGGNRALESKLETLGERAATTVVTEYELLRAPRSADVEDMLETMEIYEYDRTAAGRSAKIFKELKKGGKMINEMDILIASIAAAHDELLVTLDKDFRRIENLKLLVL